MGHHMRWARLTLILAGGGLYVAHATQTLLRDLGVTERFRPEDVLAAQLDRPHSYRIEDSSGQELGQLDSRIERVDAGFRMDLRLHLPQVELLPGIQALNLGSGLGLFSGGLRFTGPLHGGLSLGLDARSRPVEASVDGNFQTWRLTAEGRFASDGFTGSATLGEQAPWPVRLPQLRPDLAVGLVLLAGLPPGLRPGDRFARDTLVPDLSGQLRRETLIYNVIGHSPGADDRVLVELTRQGDAQYRVLARIHADARGTVLRAEQSESGLRMVLKPGVDTP
jgi:hypothetical protein